MRYTTIASAGLLAFASSAAATSTQGVYNHCVEPIFLTFTDGSGTTTGPVQLNNAGSYTRPIVGTGNAIGITKSSDYWNSPKLAWGTSTSDGVLYWSANNAGGDPFVNEAFNVTSAGLAGQTTQASTQVFAGKDANVPLNLHACYHRAGG